jgi:Homeobox KN domain
MEDGSNHGRPPTVLLPTKVYTYPDRQGRQVFQSYPHLGFRYTAQPVMHWVESLVAATEVSEQQHRQQQHPGMQPPRAGVARSQQQHQGPITLQGVQLSAPSTIPATAPWITRHQPVFQALKEGTTKQGMAAPDVGVPGTALRQINIHSQAKNWQQAVVPPRSWNLTYLHQRDPKAREFSRQISTLASKWEDLCLKMNTTNDADNDDGGDAQSLESEYQMIQARLEFGFGRIVGQYPYGTSFEKGEPRELLNKLYEDTLENMYKLLLGSIERKEQERSNCSSPITTANGDVLQSPGTSSNVSPKSSSSNGSSGSGIVLVASNGKKDLSSYMTNWLREHWTNPYPDDDGLEQMASDCETTQTVVSNWLINARTRKWRPAIVKACDMRRPAHLLRKDSMAIFAGLEVADLNDILRHEKERQQQQVQEQRESHPATMAAPPQQPFQVPMLQQSQSQQRSAPQSPPSFHSHQRQQQPATHQSLNMTNRQFPQQAQQESPPSFHIPQPQQPNPKRFKTMHPH